jgi:hypothetical protein
MGVEVKDSVVSGDIHTGDVINHHYDSHSSTSEPGIVVVVEPIQHWRFLLIACAMISLIISLIAGYYWVIIDDDPLEIIGESLNKPMDSPDDDNDHIYVGGAGAEAQAATISIISFGLAVVFIVCSFIGKTDELDKTFDEIIGKYWILIVIALIFLFLFPIFTK